MKLSDYAKNNGISYLTAYRWWKKGQIKGRQAPSGTILIDEEKTSESFNKQVALYARVSSSENKDNLETQLQRIRSYATAKGYTINHEVKEIGSGINANRKKLLALLKNNNYSIIIVEHKDRFARFGVEIIEELLKQQDKTLEIINKTECDENITQDLIDIITSYAAKIYGRRRSKRRTEKLIKILEGKNGKTKKKRDNIKQNAKQAKTKKTK